MIRPDAPGNGEITTAPRLPRSPRQLRFAYEERIQQCRDGYSRGRSEELDGRDTRPQRLARTLRALSATAEAGDLSDEHQETKHLVAVSLALRDYGEAWKSHPPQPVADRQPAD